MRPVAGGEEEAEAPIDVNVCRLFMAGTWSSFQFLGTEGCSAGFLESVIWSGSGT